jgi:hypothetical protein
LRKPRQTRPAPDASTAPLRSCGKANGRTETGAAPVPHRLVVRFAHGKLPELRA